jgi:integrase
MKTTKLNSGECAKRRGRVDLTKETRKALREYTGRSALESRNGAQRDCSLGPHQTIHGVQRSFTYGRSRDTRDEGLKRQVRIAGIVEITPHRCHSTKLPPRSSRQLLAFYRSTSRPSMAFMISSSSGSRLPTSPVSPTTKFQPPERLRLGQTIWSRDCE